jgi:hypothetical protein
MSEGNWENKKPPEYPAELSATPGLQSSSLTPRMRTKPEREKAGDEELEKRNSPEKILPLIPATRRVRIKQVWSVRMRGSIAYCGGQLVLTTLYCTSTLSGQT